MYITCRGHVIETGKSIRYRLDDLRVEPRLIKGLYLPRTCLDRCWCLPRSYILSTDLFSRGKAARVDVRVHPYLVRKFKSV
jgi:hypothetical protein